MQVEGKLGRTVRVYADVDLYPENGDYYFSQLSTISMSTRDEIATVFLRNTKVAIEMVTKVALCRTFLASIANGLAHVCKMTFFFNSFPDHHH
jgi:hypothetical protein